MKILLSTAGLFAELHALNSGAFVDLVISVARTLSVEREKGRCGEAEIDRGLILIEPSSSLTVVGDIHGDLNSFMHILGEANLLTRLREQKTRMLLLGDYVDRGERSTEVLLVVLRLKQEFPESVFLLRGNHEGPPDLGVSPHDLPHDLKVLFREQAGEIYRQLQTLFDNLYLSAILEGRYLFVHGGVPESTRSLRDIANAQQDHPAKTNLEEILWSDPAEILEGTTPSPRGAGRLFGEDVTRRVLRQLRVKTLIRGHTPASDGVMASQNGAVLTLFSRKGAPYFNPMAAYLELNCTSEALSADQLTQCANRF